MVGAHKVTICFTIFLFYLGVRSFPFLSFLHLGCHLAKLFGPWPSRAAAIQANARERLAGGRRVRCPRFFERNHKTAPAGPPGKSSLGLDPSLRGTGYGVIRLARPCPRKHWRTGEPFSCPANWERSPVPGENRPNHCATCSRSNGPGKYASSKGCSYAQNLQTAPDHGAKPRGAGAGPPSAESWAGDLRSRPAQGQTGQLVGYRARPLKKAGGRQNGPNGLLRLGGTPRARMPPDGPGPWPLNARAGKMGRYLLWGAQQRV